MISDALHYRENMNTSSDERLIKCFDLFKDCSIPFFSVDSIVKSVSSGILFSNSTENIILKINEKLFINCLVIYIYKLLNKIY